VHLNLSTHLWSGGNQERIDPWNQKIDWKPHGLPSMTHRVGSGHHMRPLIYQQRRRVKCRLEGEELMDRDTLCLLCSLEISSTFSASRHL
jgi:hypothetical protein